MLRLVIVIQLYIIIQLMELELKRKKLSEQQKRINTTSNTNNNEHKQQSNNKAQSINGQKSQKEQTKSINKKGMIQFKNNLKKSFREIILYSKKVKILNLSGSYLNDQQFLSLLTSYNQIHQINISDTHITDISAKSIVNHCKCLTKLNVSYTNITNTFILQIQSILKDLIQLNLNFTKIKIEEVRSMLLDFGNSCITQNNNDPLEKFAENFQHLILDQQNGKQFSITYLAYFYWNKELIYLSYTQDRIHQDQKVTILVYEIFLGFFLIKILILVRNKKHINFKEQRQNSIYYRGLIQQRKININRMKLCQNNRIHQENFLNSYSHKINSYIKEYCILKICNYLKLKLQKVQHKYYRVDMVCYLNAIEYFTKIQQVRICQEAINYIANFFSKQTIDSSVIEKISSLRELIKIIEGSSLGQQQKTQIDFLPQADQVKKYEKLNNIDFIDYDKILSFIKQRQKYGNILIVNSKKYKIKQIVSIDRSNQNFCKVQQINPNVQLQNRNSYIADIIQIANSDQLNEMKYQFSVIKSLNHYNIANVYDWVIQNFQNKKYAVVLYKLGLESLKNYLKRNIQNAQKLELAIQITEGLIYLHQNQIINANLQHQYLIFDPKKLYLKITKFNRNKASQRSYQNDLKNLGVCLLRLFKSQIQLKQVCIDQSYIKHLIQNEDKVLLRVYQIILICYSQNQNNMQKLNQIAYSLNKYSFFNKVHFQKIKIPKGSKYKFAIVSERHRKKEDDILKDIFIQMGCQQQFYITSSYRNQGFIKDLTATLLMQQHENIILYISFLQESKFNEADFLIFFQYVENKWRNRLNKNIHTNCLYLMLNHVNFSEDTMFKIINSELIHFQILINDEIYDHLKIWNAKIKYNSSKNIISYFDWNGKKKTCQYKQNQFQQQHHIRNSIFRIRQQLCFGIFQDYDYNPYIQVLKNTLKKVSLHQKISFRYDKTISASLFKQKIKIILNQPQYKGIYLYYSIQKIRHHSNSDIAKCIIKQWKNRYFPTRNQYLLIVVDINNPQDFVKQIMDSGLASISVMTHPNFEGKKEYEQLSKLSKWWTYNLYQKYNSREGYLDNKGIIYGYSPNLFFASQDCRLYYENSFQNKIEIKSNRIKIHQIITQQRPYRVSVNQGENIQYHGYYQKKLNNQEKIIQVKTLKGIFIDKVNEVKYEGLFKDNLLEENTATYYTFHAINKFFKTDKEIIFQEFLINNKTNKPNRDRLVVKQRYKILKMVQPSLFTSNKSQIILQMCDLIKKKNVFAKIFNLSQNKVYSHKYKQFLNLRDNNILMLSDIFLINNVNLYVVFDKVSYSFHQILNHSQKLSMQSMLRYTRQITEGIYYLHYRNNIKAYPIDFNPSNVYINANTNKVVLLHKRLKEFLDFKQFPKQQQFIYRNSTTADIKYNQVWGIGILMLEMYLNKRLYTEIKLKQNYKPELNKIVLNLPTGGFYEHLIKIVLYQLKNEETTIQELYTYLTDPFAEKFLLYPPRPIFNFVNKKFSKQYNSDKVIGQVYNTQQFNFSQVIYKENEIEELAKYLKHSFDLKQQLIRHGKNIYDLTVIQQRYIQVYNMGRRRHMMHERLIPSIPRLVNFSCQFVNCGINDRGINALSCNLPNLIRLNLQFNRITLAGFGFIMKNLVNLAYLNLDNNLIRQEIYKNQEIQLTNNMKNLKQIRLYGNCINDYVLMEISKSVKLCNIFMNCKNIDQRGWYALIHNVKEIQHIALQKLIDWPDEQNKLQNSPVNIRRICQGYELFLRNTNMTDERLLPIIEIVKHIDIVTVVLLSGNFLGRRGLNAVINNMPFIKSLNVGWGTIGKSQPENPDKTNLTVENSKIQFIQLWTNDVNDDDITHIARKCRKMKKLGLMSNKLTHRGAMEIAKNLTELQYLDIRYNQIGPQAALQLAKNLKNLKKLQLQSNNIPEAIKNEIRNLMKDKDIILTI